MCVYIHTYTDTVLFPVVWFKPSSVIQFQTTKEFLQQFPPNMTKQQLTKDEWRDEWLRKLPYFCILCSILTVCFICINRSMYQITLSKPFCSNLLPRASPMPARAMTGFSPMGSATKSLCFWDVDDMASLERLRNQLVICKPKRSLKLICVHELLEALL